MPWSALWRSAASSARTADEAATAADLVPARPQRRPARRRASLRRDHVRRPHRRRHDVPPPHRSGRGPPPRETGRHHAGPGRAPMTSPAPVSSRLSPLWVRSRGVLLAVLLIAVAGITLAALQQGDERGELDPPPTIRGAAGLWPPSSLTTASGYSRSTPSPLSANGQARTPPCWPPSPTGSPASNRRPCAPPRPRRTPASCSWPQERPPSPDSRRAPRQGHRPSGRPSPRPARSLPHSARAPPTWEVCATPATRPGPNAATPPTACPPCSASPPGRPPRKAPRECPRRSSSAPRTSCTTAGSTTTAIPPSRSNSSAPARTCSGTSPPRPTRPPRRRNPAASSNWSPTLFRRGPGGDLARSPPGSRRQRGPARRRTGLGDDRGPGPSVPPGGHPRPGGRPAARSLPRPPRRTHWRSGSGRRRP